MPNLKGSRMTAKILVLDDDDDMRGMVSSFLKNEGYDVDVAEGLSAAKRLVESNDYDIMLVDKNIPGIEGNSEAGMDFLRHARSRHLPSEVIMMTGYPTIETVVEAMKLGAFDYIQKPFSIQDLRRKIQRLLQYRSLINRDYTIAIYRGIREQILKLMENRSAMTGKDLDQALLSLDEEIDKLFKVLKESEKLVLLERESLAHIATLAEQLKMNMSSEDDSRLLVEEIARRSENRL